MCPYCMKPIAQCKCAKGKKLDADKPVGDGRVRVSREKKGRGGKLASVIVGLPLNQADLKALAKKLKASCGTGGTAKDGVIVIQGDHRDTLVTALKALGYDAKPSGG
ncbi:MAG: translation initiation factor 1 [Bradymonadia bacterium]|jgi:translation initiation factor 1